MSFPDPVETLAEKLCPASHRAPDEGLPRSCHDCHQTAEELVEALLADKFSLRWPGGEMDIAPDDAQPRRFVLRRKEDPTGISGTGTVAFGVEWPDGTCSLCWNTTWRSLVNYVQGIHAVYKIHGHEGLTEIVWID